MLRFISMAMQQSGKGAPEPVGALSDEAADQFASSFTPAWDNEEASSDTAKSTAEATLVTGDVDALPPAPDAPPIIAMPVIFAGSKQTMIGVAAPANAPAAEDLEPENLLEIVTDRPAQAAPAAPPPVQAAPPVHVNHAAHTQVMDSRPPPPQSRQAPSSNAPPSAAPRAVARNAGAAVAADPFRKASPSEDLDYVPKKSSKAFIFVIAGLAVAAGLGLFLKFALTDDAPKAPPQQLVTGPAVATAEIPPPPPKVEAPPPTATTATTAAPSGGAAAPAKAEPAPPPAPLAPPPRQAAVAPPPDRAAPRNEPRQPRQSAPPPQAAIVAPPPAAAPPRTPPKPPNGSIVRDNPF